MPSILQALRDGARRVNAAPAVFAGAWAVTIAVTVQVAFVLGIRDVWLAIEWVEEIAGQPTDAPALTLQTLPSAATIAAACTSVVAWLFLTGGIVDRFARDRPTHAHGFFAACGVFFLRFVRLAIIEAVVYALVFRFARPPIVGHALALACSLIFDYAKVRAVVEDRRSMIGALAAAMAFVKRNAAAAVTVYAIDFAIFTVVVAAFRLLAASALGAALYVAARLWVKLLFWASETALFQARLAHAGYVARPDPVWPDSPTAEGLL